MDVQILHSGFDGLRFTVQTEIGPQLRAELAPAKAQAKERNCDIEVRLGNVTLTVSAKGNRTFVADTGDQGAIWFFEDPEDRIPNNPGIRVDFRALGLATGGLLGAEAHFREVMAALAVPYAEHLLRVTRADFAVDILAPWFTPDWEALVTPPGTKSAEYTGLGETETHATGCRVTGIRAGAIANRQIAIYDKRVEVIQQHKAAWPTIWNAERAAQGQPPLDLKDPTTSQVWRFEMRLGSKQLRNRFAIKSWDDVHSMIGDAFEDASRRIRYCVPTSDSNRSRWPTHPLWRLVEDVIGNDLYQNCCGVLPSDVIEANRTEKMRELDRQLVGLFVTRAAISEVGPEEFYDFMDSHIPALQRNSEEHPNTIEERMGRAAARYRWR